VSAEEPLAFASMVEALRRALGDRLDERTHQKFEALGIPMRGKIASTYPRDAWMRVSLYAGEVLNPALAPEAQRVALGRRFVRGYSETMVGKALLAAMRVLGPRRALMRLERSFRTGNNYSRAELRALPSGALELDIIGAPYPEWYEGMVLEALAVTGAHDAVVKPIRYRPPEITTYAVSFRG
jgi:uncharacterized protein (TIGR02265 family)